MSDFPIDPLYDRVFIKKDSEEKSEGGVFLPQSVKGRAKTGTVVATGPGQIWEGQYIGLSVKPGDRVFVKEFGGYPISYAGHEVYVFTEAEIIGVIKTNV